MNQNEILDDLYEEYIQEFFNMSNNNAQGEYIRFQNFMNDMRRQRYFHMYPSLETQLANRIRENIFETIDEWLENDFMTLENHREFEEVFGRRRTLDGGRKSVRKKQNRRKSRSKRRRKSIRKKSKSKRKRKSVRKKSKSKRKRKSIRK